MNLRQAAQQALEALETCSEDEWHNDDDFGMMQIYDEGKVTQAITALRAALAEPEQNPFDGDAERYARKLHEDRESYKAIFTEHKPQTTHWEGCEAVHPECRKPEQEPVAFDHSIGADRFRVVRGAFWWHVLIGDSPTEHGKFRSRAGAEKMAADLLREFRNGAFVQHEAAPTPRKPLTDEEIDRVTDQQWAQNNHKPIYAAHRAYARAVIAAYERKNGITGETK